MFDLKLYELLPMTTVPHAVRSCFVALCISHLVALVGCRMRLFYLLIIALIQYFKSTGFVSIEIQ